MGPFGTSELIIVAVVLLLLFGAKRMPEMARGLGQSLKIFKTEMSKPADSDAANAVIVNPAPTQAQAPAPAAPAAETAADPKTETETTGAPAESQARPAA